MTSACPMIWQAVRMACSSWSRRISPPWSESRLARPAGAAHPSARPHASDRVPIQTRHHPVQPKDVPPLDQLAPSLQVPLVRLPAHPTAQPGQVALDPRAPPHQGVPGQVRRQPPVQHPRAALRTGQLHRHRPTDHLQPVAHTRQQPVQLLIAELDPSRQELADARLMDPTEPRQLRLGHARLEHHLPENITTTRHQRNIAPLAISTLRGESVVALLQPPPTRRKDTRTRFFEVFSPLFRAHPLATPGVRARLLRCLTSVSNPGRNPAVPFASQPDGSPAMEKRPRS